jgi:hypothetical protein
MRRATRLDLTPLLMADMFYHKICTPYIISSHISLLISTRQTQIVPLPVFGMALPIYGM